MRFFQGSPIWHWSLIASVLFFSTPAAASPLDEANIAYGKNQMLSAIVLYRKAALAGENPALCYFNLANAYFQIDSLPQSIVYYRACLGYAPDFFRAWLNLAIVYYTLDDVGSTIAAATRSLDLEPGNKKALLLLAASYRKAGATAEAAVTFEKLAEMDHELEDPPLALSEIYRELDDDESAIHWLLRYPESGKNRPYADLLLADLYQKRGDIDRALYYVKESFNADPTNRWALYQKVSLLERQGNDLVGLEEARRGLELFPDFCELAVLGGTIALRQGKIEEAERFYTIAKKNGSADGVIGLENVRIERERQATGASTDQPLDIHGQPQESP
jgi:tetratricopeptide (TPR) repeat protein